MFFERRTLGVPDSRNSENEYGATLDCIQWLMRTFTKVQTVTVTLLLLSFLLLYSYQFLRINLQDRVTHLDQSAVMEFITCFFTDYRQQSD